MRCIPFGLEIISRIPMFELMKGCVYVCVNYYVWFGERIDVETLGGVKM